MKRFSTPVALILAATLLTQCDLIGANNSEDELAGVALLLVSSQTSYPIAMALNGSYDDNWGSSHTISAEQTAADTNGAGTWITDATTRSVLEFSNEEKTAYVKGSVPAWCTGQGTSFPNCECFSAAECYSRMVWLESGSKFYYCEIVYNKPDLAAAKADGSTANPSDPATGGCGVGSWTELTAK